MVELVMSVVVMLQEYWASVGCAIMQCSNTEVNPN